MKKYLLNGKKNYLDGNVMGQLTQMFGNMGMSGSSPDLQSLGYSGGMQIMDKLFENKKLGESTKNNLQPQIQTENMVANALGQYGGVEGKIAGLALKTLGGAQRKLMTDDCWTNPETGEEFCDDTTSKLKGATGTLINPLSGINGVIAATKEGSFGSGIKTLGANSFIGKLAGWKSPAEKRAEEAQEKAKKEYQLNMENNANTLMATSQNIGMQNMFNQQLLQQQGNSFQYAKQGGLIKKLKNIKTIN